MEEVDIMTERFLDLMRLRTAHTAIGPSTARNMGGKGMIAAARKHLQAIDLELFADIDSRALFDRKLDELTDDLQQQVTGHWGSARKFLNIYLRDVLYNRWLSGHYQMSKTEPWLELPLDSHTATALLQTQSTGQVHGLDPLPKWQSVIGLTGEASRQYQAVAQALADKKGIARVHLDIEFWRQLGEG